MNALVTFILIENLDVDQPILNLLLVGLDATTVFYFKHFFQDTVTNVVYKENFVFCIFISFGKMLKYKNAFLQAIKHVLILFELSHALLMTYCDFLNILIDIRKEHPVEYECQVSYSQKYLVVS